MVDIAAAFAACAWVYLVLFHGRFWSVRPLLARAPSPGDRSARIAVVIPARDEAETIGQTVASLAAQDWPGTLDIWVVDDSSTDDTAEIARGAGASVITAPPLQPGWTGKMWALSRGVNRALQDAPDYLLFTDADIVHAPDSLSSLIARAQFGRFDIVSVMVKLHCESTAERLLIPAFVFFFFMLYPPAWTANRNRRTAGAAGGCILIRPEALRRIGGIDAIRHELIDDCALAAAVKRTGGAVWLGLSENTRSIRLYPAFADIRNMIARTAFTQLRYNAALLAGTVAGMLLLYVAPLVSFSWIGLVTWLLMTIAYLPMVRFYGQPAWTALLLPVAGMFYTAATVESAIRYWTGRGGAWKGRHQAAAG